MKLVEVIFITVLLHSIAIAQSKTERIDEFIKRCGSIEIFSGSVLVMQNGEVLYKGSVGLSNREDNISNTPDTKFRIGSITKSFTAVIMMKLVEEKKINFNDPLIKYLPDYPKDKGDKIKVKHLLWHQSGIPNFTDFSTYKNFKAEHLELHGLVSKFWEMDLEFEPGSKYKYSNSGYAVLGYIIETVTGKKYETVLHDYILKPLEMNNSGMCTEKDLKEENHANGYEKAQYIYEYVNADYEDLSYSTSGGIYSTVDDLYKFSKVYSSNIVLSKKYAKKLYKNYWLGHCYGCFVYKEIEGKNKLLNINHGGRIEGFKGLIENYVNDSLVIVILSNIGKGDIYNIADQIRHIVYNNPYELPKTPISLAVLREREKNGINSAIDYYYILKKDSSHYYNFSMIELNDLAYKLIGNKEFNDAVKILDVNIKEYPESHNAYEYKGDALITIGDTSKAIDSYLESLKIQSVNEPVIEKLKAIGYDIELKNANYNIDVEVLNTYVGVYKLNTSIEMDVTIEGDSLFVQRTNWPNVKIFPKSDNIFTDASGDAKIVFNMSKKGKVESLTLIMKHSENTYIRKGK